MQVTDRHGQRVGHVEGLRCLLQPEEQRDHLLDLVLLRAAVADHRALDLGWRVLDDVAARLDGGEHRHTAGVPEFQCAAGVGGVKQILDGDAVGAAGGKLRGQFTMDAGKPVRKRVACGRNDRAAGHEAMASAVRLHASIAGALGAGVDAKDSHASASISFSSMSKLAHTCCTSSWSSTASYSFSICRAS